MQLIQELTPLQQAGAGAAAIILLVLVLVVLRRRRKEAATADADQPANDTATRRGFGRKARGDVPRRKRRKLAAEAQMSMGVGATQNGDEVAGIVVPPVPAPVAAVATVEAAPETVEVDAEAPPAPAVAVLDDPYVSEFEPSELVAVGVAAPDASGEVVADPGWPAPGELTTSFDPDAFDPLPDFTEEVDEDEVDEQPTQVIDLAAIAEASAQEPETQVDDEFDPATGWSETAPSPPAGQLAFDSNGSHDGAETDLDHIWTDSDDQGEWDGTSQVEILAPAATEDLAELDVFPGTGSAEDVDDELPSQWTMADFDAGLDEAASFAEEQGDGAFHAYGSAQGDAAPADQPARFSLGGNGQGSPVVLDIAALAAAGKPVELLIEPNADGSGVRLRIETPGEAHAPVEAADPTIALGHTEAAVDAGAVMASEALDEAVVVEEASDTEAVVVEEAADTEPVVDPFEDFDVPFLTGGPVPEPESPAVEPVPHDKLPEAVALPIEPQPPADLAMDVSSPAPVQGANGGHFEGDEDATRILAEIRARLAALDARRDDDV